MDTGRRIEVRRRAHARANAWRVRAVEGVTADRRISKRLKGKVISTCVTPACLPRTKTLALTDIQQRRLQKQLSMKNSKTKEGRQLREET